jgi:hypothetical protein
VTDSHLEEALAAERDLDLTAATQDGWCLGDGSAPTKVAVNTGRSILAAMLEAGLAPPTFMPAISGGIDIEWENPVRVIDISIDVNGSMSGGVIHFDEEDANGDVVLEELTSVSIADLVTAVAEADRVNREWHRRG